MTVYERDYWWSDKWDQLVTGRDYDFNRPFFVQFAELMKKAPLPNLMNSNCVNSEYGNHSLNCKNCYLFHASADSENCAYATGAVNSKDSLDLYKAFKATECYQDTLSVDINRVHFSFAALQSIQSEFLYSCTNVQNSFGCVNLRNRSYCLWNQELDKESYGKKRAEYDLGSWQQLQKIQKEFDEFTLRFPRKYGGGIKSENVTGAGILNSKNCRNVFDVFGGLEDCKYICHAFSLKDSYDCYGAGRASQLLYEAIDTGAEANRIFAAIFTHSCQDTSYTYACHGSKDLFGCVGLRSKRYCIFNKQYTKEEYETLLPKIKKQMEEMPYVDSKGRVYKYGEFFPVELSPFAYNETIAQEYAPLTKSATTASGYAWRDPEIKHHAVTIKSADLPDHIKDVPDSILKDIIECAHKGECNQQCSGAFKIIPSELQFLKHFNIALPRLCPNCRHYERLTQRTPFKLWKRSCQCEGVVSTNGTYQNIAKHAHADAPCRVSFETSYSPEGKEIVYCESCYQAEVA